MGKDSKKEDRNFSPPIYPGKIFGFGTKPDKAKALNKLFCCP